MSITVSRLIVFSALIVLLWTPVMVRGESVVPIFTPASPNPVLAPSQSWEGAEILSVSVVFDQGQFKAWYSAGKVSEGVFVGAIGYATSNDGVSWTKYSGNPVFVKGAGFDSASVAFPSVVKVGGQYFMYYRGSDGSSNRVGLASSNDGLSWTRYPSNPLFSGTQPSVVFANNQWNMWYANQQLINYATSTDGKAWTQIGSNVVPVPSGRVNAFAPSVVYAGGVFHMWFASDSSTNPSQDISRLFYATSNDGKTWTVYADDPVPAATDIGYPSSIAGATSYLWFHKGSGLYLATTTMPIPEFGAIAGNLSLVFALVFVCVYFIPRKSFSRR